MQLAYMKFKLSYPISSWFVKDDGRLINITAPKKHCHQESKIVQLPLEGVYPPFSLRSSAKNHNGCWAPDIGMVSLPENQGW
jgi:hypothetical protein